MELSRILAHELFHFASIRLGRPPTGAVARFAGVNISCESFCDGAACFHPGSRGHAEFTLAPRFLWIPLTWLQQLLAGGKISTLNIMWRRLGISDGNCWI